MKKHSAGHASMDLIVVTIYFYINDNAIPLRRRYIEFVWIDPVISWKLKHEVQSSSPFRFKGARYEQACSFRNFSSRFSYIRFFIFR
jgi:predicted secreted Zn-dependent protease